jgi:hypothetical protein
VNWWLALLFYVVPYVVASIVEGIYDTPASVNWWLGGCICLSGVVGVYVGKSISQ